MTTRSRKPAARKPAAAPVQPVPVEPPAPAVEGSAEEVAEVVAEQSPPPVELVAGRPKCTVKGCEIPEFMDNAGLCGGHWSNRPDLRKGARRG